MSERPTLDDVRAAQERLHGIARVTPVYSSETLSRLAGRPVLLKAENLQRTGAFKIRGAFNTIAQLSAAERERGVVTASAGNHGQAVAWAAREAGIGATIFVPEAAPMAKVEAARGYGAEVELAGEGFDETVAVARAREQETGATFVHAFDDPRVIAGQGTLGLELAGQLPAGELTVVVPVGGGGLASGVAVALDSLRPEVRLVGVQSAACAPFAGREPAVPARDRLAGVVRRHLCDGGRDEDAALHHRRLHSPASPPPAGGQGRRHRIGVVGRRHVDHPVDEVGLLAVFDQATEVVERDRPGPVRLRDVDRE